MIACSFGFQWLPVITNGCQLLPVVSDDCQWLPIDRKVPAGIPSLGDSATAPGVWLRIRPDLNRSSGEGVRGGCSIPATSSSRQPNNGSFGLRCQSFFARAVLQYTQWLYEIPWLCPSSLREGNRRRRLCSLLKWLSPSGGYCVARRWIELLVRATLEIFERIFFGNW